MSPVEIVFVILGAALLIGSCFVTGNGKSEEKEAAGREEEPGGGLSVQQEKALEERIDQIFEEHSENIIVKTDDYLSKISNEKIIAVNDFTEQILEKINTNHKDVVFLYERLLEKEDEIKETVQGMEDVKRQVQQQMTDIVRLAKQLGAALKKAESAPPLEKAEEPKPAKTSTRTRGTRTKKESAAVKGNATGSNALESNDSENNALQSASPVQKTTGAQKRAASGNAGTVSAVGAAGNTAGNGAVKQQELPELMQADNKNEEILRLYKQGKTVLEISKLLGLGQGEVKLVIGLYGM